jgi:dihydroorotate dehydrogenase electron transfer subunit
MISVPGVFLRRPISVHDSKKGCITFLYKIAGKGTKILSTLESGEIKVLGPLGSGYDLKLAKNSEPVIAAGGTGIASVHFLASKLKKNGTLFYGARSKEDLLCLGQFKKLGWKIVLATDDGSKGHKGFITDLLESKLNNTDTLFACGPSPMLKKVLKIAKDKKVKGFVSLEEKMACGMGNCQGCAVKINGVNKMACKDGPVFKIEETEI